MSSDSILLEKTHDRTGIRIFLSLISAPHFDREHLQRLIQLARDPNLVELMGWNPLFEISETQAFIDALACIALPYSIETDPMVFGIYADPEQLPVGYAVLKGLNRELGTAEVGVAVLDPVYRPRGFGRLALDRMVSYAFECLNLQTVGAAILATNQRSINMCRKTGFRLREVMPNSWSMPDGQVVDMVWMERNR